MRFFSACVATITLTFFMGATVRGDDVSHPNGDVILTVTGSISQTNLDDALVFDLQGLDALEQAQIDTTTIWTDGVQRFEGVDLSAFVEQIGAAGTTLRATALNDYTVEIPIADAVPGGPIIATRLNGKEMSVRDKGPLWIVYPYDSAAKYRTEVIYSRSIWQLDRIEVVE